MKTAAEVIEAIKRLSPSEQQEMKDWIMDLMAAEQAGQSKSSNPRETEKNHRGNS